MTRRPLVAALTGVAALTLAVTACAPQDDSGSDASASKSPASRR